MSGWQPLSRRNTPHEPEGLYEGVPPHLTAPLRAWVDANIDPFKSMIGIRLRLPLDGDYVVDDSGTALRFLDYLSYDPNLWLDVVDAILWHHAQAGGRTDLGPSAFAKPARQLDTLLHLGGSAWRVSADHSALERRVDETVSQGAAALMDQSTSAAEHLRQAWSSCYGRNPDPSKAYSEAIKAIEAAAIPVVSPNDSTATLGKVIGTMRAHPQLFSMAIGDSVQPVLVLMDLVWTEQNDRHAGLGPTPKISQEEAEMAMHASLTLVHWFTNELIRRVPRQQS